VSPPLPELLDNVNEFFDEINERKGFKVSFNE
jgi:hypothetical protein